MTAFLRAKTCGLRRRLSDKWNADRHNMSTMSKRPPWFWNTALLERLTWLLLAVVLTAYAGRALAQWGWP
jgi:hypothetical protein